MTSELVTVGPDAPFKKVVKLLLDREISALPVVNEAGKLLGLVTEADVMAKEAYGGRRRRPLGLLAEYLAGRDPNWLRRAEALVAADLMTRDGITVEPEADVRAAARTMLERNVKRLLVVDDTGRPIGIVTRGDVLRLFHAPDEDVAAAVRELLADPWRVPEHLEVTATVNDGMVRLEGSVAFPSDRALVEHTVQALPGVVGIESRLIAREPEPRSSSVARA